jgi:alkanesulfonate monooxygenase SsuD/methylene tetrahydromethanopterin reductase-like flavin-dependent oxidoreductase (luciferase family)
MTTAIPDEMVETFAIVGTADEVRGKINALWELADSLTVVAPSNFLGRDQITAYQQAITETLYL